MTKNAGRQSAESTPSAQSHDAPSLSFGLYPGSATGTDSTNLVEGPPDDPVRIQQALDQLQGDARPLIVRGYEPFCDWDSQVPVTRGTPEAVEQYACNGRRLDLVLMFQSASGNVDGYVEFVRDRVRKFGPIADTIQVTEEANVPTGPPFMDGGYPRVREALVQGVLAAKDEATGCGYEHLRIGFNAAPSFNPTDDFWPSIGALGGASLVESIDYVGLDFFPDVFRPVAPDGQPGDLREMVVVVLRAMRETWMPAAGIPASIPIHITENGWPTGPDRSCERQAIVLETILRTVHGYRGNYNIARYELFDLRDADSNNPDLFYQFGILRDDYRPKPAFDVFRRLIRELGGG